MKLFFVLASFALVLSTVLGSAADLTIIKLEQSRYGINLRGNYVTKKITRCVVASKTLGKNYTVFPHNKTPHFYEGTDHYCLLEIRVVQPEYHGVWTVITTTEDGKTSETKYGVEVQEDVTTRPASTFSAYPENIVSVYLDGNEADVESCILTSPYPEKIKYDLLAGTVDGFERYRGCGVRMPINATMYGSWSLTQKIGYLTQTGVFKLKVLIDDKEEPDVRNETWILGKPRRLTIEKNDMEFCQFTRPDGSVTQVIRGRCELEIKVVTLFHHGLWRASYGSAGRMDLRHVDINVSVWDSSFFDGMVIAGPGQEINLLCRSGVQSLTLCVFIRPDKYVIHAPPGVGNANYSYYGTGYTENHSSDQEYSECGLTIHNPSDDDFGPWTCEVGVGTETLGTVIQVAKLRSARTFTVQHPDVFVKHGKEAKIRCSINAKLEYCWLTSPNGTTYSVMPGDNLNQALRYNGKGFYLGDCGAIIQPSAIEDGKWTCHLGILDRPEIEETVSVHVSESFLTPVEGKVVANKNATLTCKNFFTEEGSIRYCRWIQPNGHGITDANAMRFKTETTMNTCELTILEIQPEDIGEWTCVAMIDTKQKMEQSATLKLVASSLGSSNVEEETTSVSTVSIVLGTGLCIMTIIGAFFMGMHFYHRRTSSQLSSGAVATKSPPPYNPDDYELPRSVRLGLDDHINDKDYKY